MFGILLLLTFPLFGDPDEDRPVVAESSTVPKVAAPNPDHAVEETAITAGGRIRSLLQQWEATSKQQGERSNSALQSLRLNVSRELNGHAALALEQLSGRVRAGQLEEQFSWSLAEENDDQICLEARPKDETEHLFYSSIRVWLESKTSRLIKLQATDRAGQARTAWTAPQKTQDPEIIKVAYVAPDGLDDAIPPWPAVLNRERINAARNALASSVFNPVKLKPDPTDLSPVSPELAEILDKWEAASRDMKTVKIRFRRTVYNVVFETEKRSDGVLCYEAPDKISLTIKEPEDKSKVGLGATSDRLGKSGHRFRIETDRPETWILTAKEILAINDEEKSFERTTIPEINGGWGWFVPPPWTYRSVFLVDVHAEQVRKEWTLEIKKRNGANVYLTATPRTSNLKKACSRCVVIIDTNTWQTSAIKLFDPSDNLETVVVVEERMLNPTLLDDRFNPLLESRGYREIKLGK